MIWFAVIVGSLGCFVFKYLGYTVPQSLLDRPIVRSMTTLLPVALLGALVAVQTFAVGQTLQLDARLAGLVVAVIALLLRAPFLVVVVVAAITAAALRATGLAV